MPRHCFRGAAKPHTPKLNLSSFPVPAPAARSIPMARWSLRLCCLLLLSVAVVVLAGGVGAHADSTAGREEPISLPNDAFAGFITEASQRFGIPASWIRAVMQVESAGHVRALSPKGALGLMQIMPETWAYLRARYGLGDDPYDAHDNIQAGAAYLRELHDRYGSPSFLAAYNAGPSRYEDHLIAGLPLPAETEAYVATLVPIIAREAIDGGVIVDAAVRPWTVAPLFAVQAGSTRPMSPSTADLRAVGRPGDKAAADWTGLAPQSAGLFVSMSNGYRQP